MLILPKTISDTLDKNWRISDLSQFGFENFKYYRFKTNFGEWWYNHFGDRFFKVKKTLITSEARVDCDGYTVYVDEWGETFLYYQEGDSTETYESLFYTYRHDYVRLTHIFNAIRKHKRNKNLQTFFNE